MIGQLRPAAAMAGPWVHRPPCMYVTLQLSTCLCGCSRERVSQQEGHWCFLVIGGALCTVA